MFRLEITESAESDLDEITDYIGRTLCNPPAVATLLDAIDAACSELTEMPEIFPLCADPRLADLGYRKAVIKSYIMVYEIDEDEEVIHVLRFFHGSENYADKML